MREITSHFETKLAETSKQVTDSLEARIAQAIETTKRDFDSKLETVKLSLIHSIEAYKA